jgi:sarcosine oxidase / L-pipecolate oxidase
MNYSTETKILIVGAGCFGLSTGYHLLKRGYREVTIIDRSEVLPAPDAASTDLNKGWFFSFLGKNANLPPWSPPF